MKPSATLAVEMFGQRKLRPVVKATIDGVPAQMEFDTGASTSLLFASGIGKFALKTEPLPPGVVLTSAGQKFDATLARVQDFEVSEIVRHDVAFTVTDTRITPGIDGLFGAREMGDDTLEIDLAGGAIRFFAPCNAGSPAYWADPAQVQSIDIEPVTPDSPRIFGQVKINGVTLRALFDTGTPTTLLTAKAAAKAGVTPGMPSVVESGFSQGIGPTQLKAWTGQFASISFGNDSWLNPKLEFAEKPNASADLLIGADFFKTHRVVISKRTSRLYFTYTGGVLYGTEPGKP